METKVKFLVLFLLLLLITQEVSAAPPRGVKVLERRRDRIIRLREAEKQNTKANVRDLKRIISRIERQSNDFQAAINILLDQMAQQLCLLSLDKYCIQPEEPEEVTWKPSISLQVRATAYNNKVDQTDRSPCEGAWSINGQNICQAYESGIQPIAISQDLVGHPLWKGNKVRLEFISGSEGCNAYNDQIFTVMDTLSECHRDWRTGRCIRPIQNQVDIFIPCGGTPGKAGYCIDAVVKAKQFGSCLVQIHRL